MVSRITIRRMPQGRDESSSSTTTSSSEMPSSESPKRALSPKGMKRFRRRFSFLRSSAGKEKTTTTATEKAAARLDEELPRSMMTSSSGSSEEGSQESTFRDKTKVVVAPTSYAAPPPSLQKKEEEEEDLVPELQLALIPKQQKQEIAKDQSRQRKFGFCGGGGGGMISILDLDQMCGGTDVNGLIQDSIAPLLPLPDDPTVQESIECFVGATTHNQQQLQEYTNFMDANDVSFDEEDDDDIGDVFAHQQHHQVQTPPSSFQQCLLKNRSPSHLPALFQQEVLRQSPGRKLHQQRSVAVDFLTDFDAAQAEAQAHVQATLKTACSCCHHSRPMLESDQWPQRPLLMRPSPKGGTTVKGIRFAGQDEYLWEADQSHLTWPESLRKHWSSNNNNKSGDNNAVGPSTTTTHDVICPRCIVLPINNGKELPGESLVTDFESELFEGSILVRLKGCHGTTTDECEQKRGYFNGVHRKYQVVIRGKFKRSIPWTECFAGFQLERPAGKLPPKWIVNSALNVVRFFAPQLQTRMYGPRPYSMTPLGSTPQSLIVAKAGGKGSRFDESMEIPQEEPHDAKATLLGHASNADSTMQRARYRKKHFDKLYAQKSSCLMTDPDKVYTFEFLQHLLSFEDFTIEMGSMLGSIPLQNILDGQPMQIMASHKHPVPMDNHVQNRLWCFDIWHEMLIPDAKRFEMSQQSS